MLWKNHRFPIGKFSQFSRKVGEARTLFKKLAETILKSNKGEFVLCTTPDLTMTYLASNFEKIALLFNGFKENKLSYDVVDEENISHCFWGDPKDIRPPQKIHSTGVKSKRKRSTIIAETQEPSNLQRNIDDLDMASVASFVFPFGWCIVGPNPKGHSIKTLFHATLFTSNPHQDTILRP